MPHSCTVLADARAVAVAPVAGIGIVHELTAGIEIETRDAIPWRGVEQTAPPIVVRHERGPVTVDGFRRVLDVPPWCTFFLDELEEPAILFHAVFGEVDRLLLCDVPGSSYVVRYGATPSAPVVPLQIELSAYSLALSARGAGLIAHACAFVPPGRGAVLCPGVSGTGKTTLARLLARVAMPPALLTDDRAIVTAGDDGVRAWGSPWPGAARIAGTAHAPLETVVFLRHGGPAVAREVTPQAAFREIVNALSMPLWEPARCGAALEIVDAVVSGARLIEAAYPPTIEGAQWLYDCVCERAPSPGASRHG